MTSQLAIYTYRVQIAVRDALSQFTYHDGVLDPEYTTDEFTSKIVAAMLTTSRDTVPKIKRIQGMKPYWSSHLTQLSRQEKAAWRQWISDGRPREKTSVAWQQYKAAKQDFQRSRRQAEYQYNLKSMEQLASPEQVDQRYFWYLVNKKNKDEIRGCWTAATYQR
jgi:hypothetical protein